MQEEVKKKRIRPLSGRLLVEPVMEAQEVGGFAAPKVMTPQPTSSGRIVALAPDVSKIVETELRVGDVVWYERTASMEVEHEGRKCRLVHAFNVVSVEE